MSRFFNRRFRELEAYVPGEQPQDKKYIKLNTNEMPYPPSPSVLKAINDESSSLNLYPDPSAAKLKAKLAEMYGVKSENVFLSNGSDEILSFAFMSFFDNGVSFADITYGFYKVYADLYGVNANIIPLNDDFTIDPEQYFGSANVVIANPNAPTGLVLLREEIESIIKSVSGLVLVDEAYADFGEVTCSDLVEKYDNLIVMGTYSKSRAMAGARLGFAIADKQIIDDLEKIKFSTNPYNINRLTMIAGIAALEDKNYYDECIEKIKTDRKFTTDELRKLGFEAADSNTNFVFARNPRMAGQTVYEELKKRGILVRHFSQKRIRDYVRITIGTHEQMQTLINELKNILEEA
ncbi:MAG: histidinol-phosphate transaminase [Christensenellaceae bacterium]|nr:histidinol-phosphate transaminase [Christensenellaceae bacterium]